MDPSESSKSTSNPQDSTSANLHHTSANLHHALLYSDDAQKRLLQLELLENRKFARAFPNVEDSTTSSSQILAQGGLGRLEAKLLWPKFSISYQSEPPLISSPPLEHPPGGGEREHAADEPPPRGGEAADEREREHAADEREREHAPDEHLPGGEREREHATDEHPLRGEREHPLDEDLPGGEREHAADGSLSSVPRKKWKEPRSPRSPRSQDEQYCSCKKSNCLKLYCDCFASQSFCAKSCRCHGCRNRRDYEDTVAESKEQIESRLPHAFAPKIVVTTKVSGDGSKDSSNMKIRHRVGCNCRKSMCKKKYCECYKAHVGCSSVCRCEDCKNTFGIKDASGEIGATDGKSETVDVNNEMANPGFFPITPCIQSSSSLDGPYNPLAASGTYDLSTYLDSWNSPNCSISRIRHRASGSHGAENFGSFIPPLLILPPSPPQWDDIASRSLVSPQSNSQDAIRQCESLLSNPFQGSNVLSVNPLPLTMNELDPDSNSGVHGNLEHNHEILKDDIQDNSSPR